MTNLLMFGAVTLSRVLNHLVHVFRRVRWVDQLTLVANILLSTYCGLQSNLRQTHLVRWNSVISNLHIGLVDISLSDIVLLGVEWIKLCSYRFFDDLIIEVFHDRVSLFIDNHGSMIC